MPESTIPTTDKPDLSDTTTDGSTKPLEETETTTPCPEEKLNVKTLLDVQKNSVLLKLVGAKRQKRQTAYSSYYPSQSGQTGVEAHYQTKSVKNRQRQTPKQPNYHLKQPVKGYRNPSLYMRHPVKGSYYKATANRRQFQGRYSSTTVRSTRPSIKKKFRPSPVFA